MNCHNGDPAKEQGKIRICGDMKVSIKATSQMRYPIPVLVDVVNKLKDSTIFSKLDLQSVFHQLKLATNLKYIETFRNENGIRIPSVNGDLYSSGNITDIAYGNYLQ